MGTRRKQATVITQGRTDLENLFELSGCLDGESAHHPFLAFVADGDTVTVRLFGPEQVAGLPAETPVMVQWPGKWRSDFFQMTAGDVKEAIDRRARLAERRKRDPGYQPAREGARMYDRIAADSYRDPERAAVWRRGAELLRAADPEEPADAVLAAGGWEHPGPPREPARRW